MELTEVINPIRILVFITLIFALTSLDKTERSNYLLLAILVLCSLTETVHAIFEIMGKNAGLSSTISIIVHNVLWLIIIRDVTGRNWSGNIAIFAFMAFAIANLTIIEGPKHFNYATFILGSLLYISIFLFHSTVKLRAEDFGFFTDNKFLIVFAPVIFFVGLSMLFAFRSWELHDTRVMGIRMWDWIINFVNVVYYSVLNIYIYRQRRTVYDI